MTSYLPTCQFSTFNMNEIFTMVTKGMKPSKECQVKYGKSVCKSGQYESHLLHGLINKGPFLAGFVNFIHGLYE